MHKQNFHSENYEQTFSNKKRKQSNAHEKHKQSFPSEIYNRTFHNEIKKNWPIVFFRFRYSIYVRCSILILLIKCSS